MGQMISVKLDVKKIDKNRLYVGEKGTYLSAMIFMNDQPDQFGNDGMIVESVTEDERKAGKKGAILGNVKIIQKNSGSDSRSSNNQSDTDDLPF